MNSQEIVDMLQRVAEQRGEKRGELRGELRGEKRGELRGILQGRRETILNQLRRKFGPLPEHVAARVQNADNKLLDTLEVSVLFTNSLEQTFAE